jgi:hypothetical protein
LKVLNEIVQFVLVAVVAQFLLFSVRLVAGNQELEVMAASWPQQSVVSQATVDAHDLPADQYVRLSRLALSSATARLGPRIKNPRISSAGLDPAVLTILEQQRAYLYPHNPASRQTPGDGNRSTIRTGPLPAPCLNPIIAAVNGRAAGAVFTPLLSENHYRIEGCGFGEKAGEIQLEPGLHVDSLVHTQPIMLQLDRPGAWSKTEIDVHLDPRLSGIPDFAVTLVVHLADGRRAELTGCRFIAVRDRPAPLKTIAASWVKLEATTASSHAIRQLEYVSPPTRIEEVSDAAAGMSALVIRSAPDAFIGSSDFYDFSALNPGWVVESVQIQNYSISCPGDVTRTEQAGVWETSFDAHGFTVKWASDSCSSFIPPVFRFTLSASQYAVKVWVIGPIGTEPIGHRFFATQSETRLRNAMLANKNGGSNEKGRDRSHVVFFSSLGAG